MSRVLVLGGTGFIGNALVKRLSTEGFTVTSLSLQPSWNTSQFPDVEQIQVDMSDTNRLRTSLRDLQFSYVIDCSGYVDHSTMKDGGDNIIGMHLMRVMRLYSLLRWGSIKRFIYIGSSDEYGCGAGITEMPAKTTDREEPNSPYAFSKTAVSHFLQMLHRSEGLPCCSLRLFLAYGPGQSKNRFVPQVISGCLNEKGFPVSHGNQVRDFIYIDDVVDAILAAMRSDTANGKILNLGSGQGIRIKDMVRKVVTMLGRGEPRFGELKMRKNESNYLVADIEETKELLDWSPVTAIEEGLRATTQWYLHKSP